MQGRQLKLEITHKLEMRARPNGSFRNRLRGTFSILNLPAPFHCSKACKGCINREAPARETLGKEKGAALPPKEINRLISLFAEKYGTMFITINGRGDPFHPRVAEQTLGKISHANSVGLGAYVFSAGDNLDCKTSKFLADSGTNVMISLFGNPFLDERFFSGKDYAPGNEAKIAGNLRTLIGAYAQAKNQPEDGLTRIGMNYVVGPSDADDSQKLAELKIAANQNGIFFICNTNFSPNTAPEYNGVITALARTYSDFTLAHSTSADGVCQMGAGSSITVAANGDVYRCPYMLEGSDGNIIALKEDGITMLFNRYPKQREFSCVLRKTPNTSPKEKR